MHFNISLRTRLTISIIILLMAQVIFVLFVIQRQEIKAIFEETSSIGVRYYPVGRRILERKMVQVEVLGEKIPVKVAYLEGEEVNIQPEYSDCLKLAEQQKMPVKKIMELAKSEYFKGNTEPKRK